MLSCEQRIFVDGGKGGSIRIRSAIPTLPLLDPDAARSRAVRRNASMPMVLRSGVIFTPDSPGGARRLSHSGFSHVLLSQVYLADSDVDTSKYAQHVSGDCAKLEFANAADHKAIWPENTAHAKCRTLVIVRSECTPNRTINTAVTMYGIVAIRLIPKLPTFETLWHKFDSHNLSP